MYVLRITGYPLSSALPLARHAVLLLLSYEMRHLLSEAMPPISPEMFVFIELLSCPNHYCPAS